MYSVVIFFLKSPRKHYYNCSSLAASLVISLPLSVDYLNGEHSDGKDSVLTKNKWTVLDGRMTGTDSELPVDAVSNLGLLKKDREYHHKMAGIRGRNNHKTAVIEELSQNIIVGASGNQKAHQEALWCPKVPCWVSLEQPVGKMELAHEFVWGDIVIQIHEHQVINRIKGKNRHL